MFIGRQDESKQIKEALSNGLRAQMVVLYGRRRVGKSALIKECIKKEKNVLCFEGIQGATTHEQIDQFLTDLARQTGRVKLAAKNWLEVFQGLGEIIKTGRWVIVFDEFPWMAVGQTRIISDLKFHWDRWMANKKIILFLCGSVASFMVRHLVHSKALHNRKTLEICLQPLSPAESGLFIKNRSSWEKAKMFMALGGIPKYLEQINPKISVEKNLNRLCFTANGFFVNEFETLFKEQFRVVKTYELIARLLSQAPMSLSEIATKTKVIRGGGLSDYLANLIQADFVKEYVPYTATQKRRLRTKLYKLVDPFLIFYFRYMAAHRNIIVKNTSENLFRAIMQNSLHQYYGMAFERLCEAAQGQIFKKLDLHLADVMTMGPYFQRKSGRRQGLQIDNLIMRRDSVWMVMEYKFNEKPLGIEVVTAMQQKLERLSVPSGVSIEKVLIAAGGVVASVRESDYFNAILTLDDLMMNG